MFSIGVRPYENLDVIHSSGVRPRFAKVERIVRRLLFLWSYGLDVGFVQVLGENAVRTSRIHARRLCRWSCPRESGGPQYRG